MTRVFFYHNATDRILAAATLIGKAYRQKKPVLVYAPAREVESALDRALWMYPATGFIPHVKISSPFAAETPVLLADTLDVLPQDERLLNLSPDVPPGFARFASLIEVVGQDPEERRAGRGRVKFYKDRGYEVTFFNLAEHM